MRRVLICATLGALVTVGVGQSKSSTKTEPYGDGTKVTTSTDTEAGDHVTDVEIRDAKGFVTNKNVETVNDSGTRSENHVYTRDSKGSVLKDVSFSLQDGSLVEMRTEVYENGVLKEAHLRTYQGTEPDYKIFDPATGGYVQASKEEYDRVVAHILETSRDAPTPEKHSSEFLQILKRIYKTDQVPWNGIVDYHFGDAIGDIDVNLSNEIRHSLRTSGVFDVTPSGKTPDEKAKNQKELEKLKLELPDGSKTDVKDGKPIGFKMPESGPAYLTLLKDDKPVATQTVIVTDMPVSTEPVSFPSVGQRGKYLLVRGPFNGSIDPGDSATIAGKPMRIIAESTDQRVILNDSDSYGTTKITSTENGKVSECKFRNLGIEMTADSMHLLRGQTTSLHIKVTGLNALTKPVILTVTNTTPGVIGLSGGNVQLTRILPSNVGPEGIYSSTLTISGIVAGNFNILGKVSSPETCVAP